MLQRYDELYVIGADMVDGYYADTVSLILLRILAVSSATGVRSHLVSFSFNERPSPTVAREMPRRLRRVRINARDTYSAERIGRILGRKVAYSADVAFGLRPLDTEFVINLRSNIILRKRSNRHAIGLNINLLPISKSDSNSVRAYTHNWAIIVRHLIADGHVIIFLPHDFRGPNSDEVAVKLILDELTEEEISLCVIPESRLHAWEIKALMGSVDFVISGRMHLAIAALGSGVPTVGYGYQDKFEGIFALFGQEQLVRDVHTIYSDPMGEYGFITGRLSECQELRATVRSFTEHVDRLASQNASPVLGN